VTIRCGTCAWADHSHFYPRSIRPNRRLAYYAQYFSVVEVDSSFYGIPTTQNVETWIAETQKSFVFHLKAHRTFTKHDRGALDRPTLLSQLAAFKAVATRLVDAGKLGIILLQFPPWFTCNVQNRTYVEWLIDQFNAYQVGVEFRHRSWWTQETRQETLSWLTSQRAVNVVCDEPQIGMGTIPFVPEVTNKKFVIMRLHGRNAATWYQTGLTSSQQRFDYRYTKDELIELLPSVRQWAQEVSEVHILMNNNQSNYAVVNAFDWQELLGQNGRPRPDLSIAEQLRLFD